MEKQKIFVKRYPSKGELPKEYGYYLTQVGIVHFRGWFNNWIEYWLEEIQLPGDEDVENYGRDEYWYTNMEETLEPFKKGANFILNHLK